MPAARQLFPESCTESRCLAFLMPNPCRPKGTACEGLGHRKRSSLPKSHACQPKQGVQAWPPFSPPELCFLVAISHLTSNSYVDLPNT